MKLNLHRPEKQIQTAEIATVSDNVLQKILTITGADLSEVIDYLEQANHVLEDALAAFYHDRDNAFSMS